jgi:hypothetical protein
MKNYLKIIVLFTHWNVDFRLSLESDKAHQETCLCNCRRISSDDTKNESVNVKKEVWKQKRICFVYEMLEARKLKYCLVFTTVLFTSVSWGQLRIIVFVMVYRTEASSFTLAWVVFVRHEVKHKASREGDSRWLMPMHRNHYFYEVHIKYSLMNL